MNDEQIEKLLRRAPRPLAPAGLLAKLQADIALPRQTQTAPANRTEAVPFLRRWFPAVSFAAIFLSCIVAIAVQSNQVVQLKHENQALRAATQNLEQLRRENAEFHKLLVAHQELERLRKDFAELQRLSAEVAQLRAQTQEMEKLRVENQQLIAAGRAPAQANTGDDFFERTEDPKAQAQSIRCVNNLKQIGLAARIWAIDNGDVLAPNFLSMSNELSTPKLLVCPADGARIPAPNWASFSAANVSYDYLNPNGSEAEPYVVLARCPIHNIVCLSDGSVQQLGKNRGIIMKEGKYYIADPSGRTLDVDAESMMRKRYGLPERQPAPNAPAVNPALSEEMMRRYGLIPANTNKPPEK